MWKNLRDPVNRSEKVKRAGGKGMNDGYFKINLEVCLDGCSDGKGEKGLLWMLREKADNVGLCVRGREYIGF